MADIRQIENKIRNSFAVLGNRNDHLDQPLSDIPVTGAQCGIIKGQRVIILPLGRSTGTMVKRIGGIKVEVATGLINYGFNLAGRFLLIWCMKFTLREAFNRLMADLLYDLQPSFAVTDVTSRLEGWKLLLTGNDDKNQEKGLWGELFFLQFILQNNYGSIDNWRGPQGGTKDFQFENRRAEVKTTAVRSGWPVTMHGLYQAASVQGCRDFLIFIRVEEGNSGINISELITDIKTRLPIPEIILFDSLLLVFDQDILTSERKWVPLDTRIFVMNDQMPVIRAESFTAGTLPQGVLNITYTVDLSGLPSLPLHEWNHNNLTTHA